ncbi:MAG: hypothetical protein J7559_08625, partial [Cohnella sp.]|nr:hypothetical protein [Cohnella sp.]
PEGGIDEFSIDLDGDGGYEKIIVEIHEYEYGQKGIDVSVEKDGKSIFQGGEPYDSSPRLFFYDINGDGKVEKIFNDTYRGSYVWISSFDGSKFVEYLDLPVEGLIQEIADNRIVTDIATYEFSDTETLQVSMEKPHQ